MTDRTPTLAEAAARIRAYLVYIDELNAATAERGSGWHIGDTLAGDPYNDRDLRRSDIAVVLAAAEAREVRSDDPADEHRDPDDIERRADAALAERRRGYSSSLVIFDEYDHVARIEAAADEKLDADLATMEEQLDARDMDRGEL